MRFISANTQQSKRKINVMSYGVHITRKENWFDAEGPAITQEEWLSIVHDDPDLTLELPVSDGCYADWNGQCERFDDPWLCLSAGNVSTEGFDAALVDKMVQIANRLAAKVQGEQGEIYPTVEQSPDKINANAQNVRQAWWHKLLRR